MSFNVPFINYVKLKMEELGYDVYGGEHNPNVEEFTCSEHPNIRCYYFFPDILNQPFVVYYTDDGQAAGSITAGLGDISIMIDPKYHKRGIGSLLLQHYIDFVKKRPIRLSTLETNTAMRRLAEKFGFYVVEERESIYYDDAKELVYQLDE